MSRPVVINGKFLSQKMTGVQRVAFAFAKGLKTRFEVDGRGDELSVALPNGTEPTELGLRHLAPSRLKGVPWEQLELPVQTGTRLLVNLCNVGPLTHKGDILIIHDAQAFISPQSYSKAFGTWYRTILPHLASNAARVLTVSNYSRDCLAEVGVAPAEKIEVIHNGVDHILDIRADANALQRMGLTSKTYFLAPGTTQAHKNIRVIIEAARLLETDEIPVVLFGSATALAFAEAGYNLPSNVVLAGRVSDGELRALIEGARAFLFPSATEGFGLPPLEAMLLGTPAVVAPCGALPELVDDKALFAQADSPDDWAEKIKSLARSDAQCREFGMAGMRQAQKFNWESATEKLYRVILETQRL